MLPAPALPEPPSAPRTVLFDFDGVLIRGDAFRLFIRSRYRRAPWRHLLVLLALPWMLLRWPFSWTLPVRTVVHIALFGLGSRRYTVEAKAFGALLSRRPRQFIRDGLQALRRHQAAGDRVVVVTGCEEVLVTEILAQLGLTDLDVLASQLRPGWFGMRVGRYNVEKAKPQRLAEHGITAWQLAYSDSHHDVPMLRAATEAVLVNGTPTLCKRIEKSLGRSVTRVDWY
jgi:phosphatidylglycerophosphatase C